MSIPSIQNATDPKITQERENNIICCNIDYIFMISNDVNNIW